MTIPPWNHGFAAPGIVHPAESDRQSRRTCDDAGGREGNEIA